MDQRIHLTATRLTTDERALVDAAARAEGTSVSGLLRQTVLPEAMRRLARAATERGLAAVASGDSDARQEGGA